MDSQESKTATTVLGMETLFRRRWRASPSQGTLSPAFRNFSHFSDLPVEIRLRIWKYSIEGRVVRLVLRLQLRHLATADCEGQSPIEIVDFVSPSRVPALLHACSESRSATLRPGRYELVFGGKNNLSPPKIYFNFVLDTAHFDSTPVKQISSEQFLRPLEVFEQHVPIAQIRRLRYVAMDFRPSHAKLALNYLQSKAANGVWQALRVVSLDAEHSTQLQFLAGMDFVDVSENRNRVVRAVQIYGRLFTKDSVGPRLVGRVGSLTRISWAGFGNLKMLLMENVPVNKSDLVSCVSDCGLQDVLVVS